MARKEARIFVEVWEHDRFKSLSVGAQWLYWAILSQADLSFCGVLSPACPWWASLATDASPKKVAAWLQELHDEDFVLHDVQAAQVWVVGFIRRDGVLNRSNLVVAMSRAFAEVRSTAIRNRILDELLDQFPQGILEGFANAFDNATADGKTKPIAERMNDRMVNAIREGMADA